MLLLQKKHPNNFHKSFRVYIRKLLGCTKRCLGIVSVIDITIEVSHTCKIQYFLVWGKWLTVWGGLCFLHLKKILTAYLPFASLLLDDSLVLYPSSNAANGSSQFLLLFLMNCWLNVTGPSLIYSYLKLLKHSFSCFLLSLFPHIPRPSFTFISLSRLPSSFSSPFCWRLKQSRCWEHHLSSCNLLFRFFILKRLDDSGDF